MRGRLSMWFCLKALIAVSALFLQGCIHDHPFDVNGPNQRPDNPQPNNPQPGVNPEAVKVSLDIYFNLSWETLLHYVEFETKGGTRARAERPHRFVIELSKEGETIYQATEFLSSTEFALGGLTHRLSASLSKGEYQAAVWYDTQNDDGLFSFNADDLGKVSLANLSTREGEFMHCAYASEKLDLRDINGASSSKSDGGNSVVVKELELGHAGARFELVATDIQQFITNNKAALLQDDVFTAHVAFSDRMAQGYNLHTDSFIYGDAPKLSGWMRLPYDEYDELKIAEGFLFCREEDEAEMKLSVTNSALLPVVETEYFAFPVKRGYITIVRGDFLSNSIGGLFSVDHIWEGEIIVEM